MLRTLNLATRCYYQRSRFRALLVFVMVSLLFVTGIGANRLYRDHAETVLISARSSGLDKLRAGHPSGVSTAEFTTHKATVAALNRPLKQRRTSHLSLLNILEAVTPAGVSYNAITPVRNDRSVRLDGTARTMADLTDLLERLNAVPEMTDPILLSTGETGQASKAGNGTGFSISLTWNEP